MGFRRPKLKKPALLSRFPPLVRHHRRFALAIVVLFCAFTAWFVAMFPSLYARVKLDRSFPALSRYEFERTPEIALAGSSMTFRIKEGYFLKTRPRNIAIGGGSPLTGLAIIASYPTVPRLILVEINLIFRAVDGTLLEQFGKNDAAPYQWFRPARAMISWVYYWIKYQSEVEKVGRLPKRQPSEYDISASVADSLGQYNSAAWDEASVQNTEALKQLVTNLEGRGCHVLFYELPYPDGIGNAHYAATARSLVHAAFPDPKRWPKLDFQVPQLRWVDAAHLDERSAIIVAQEIQREIQEERAVQSPR
jgi:hypothetical protein